jgi:hypothetical protein
MTNPFGSEKPAIVFPSPETEEWALTRDVEIVKSASKELLSALREICAAKTKPDLMIAITKGHTLIEKLPILEDDTTEPDDHDPEDDDIYFIK